jgi:hypothetical protein
MIINVCMMPWLRSCNTYKRLAAIIRCKKLIILELESYTVSCAASNLSLPFDIYVMNFIILMGIFL